ncbi:MAG: sensor histidine kinase [Chloroflexota bacterium]|nr:MAG: sensor histidine kinase [Chloroflexota bacterium]
MRRFDMPLGRKIGFLVAGGLVLLFALFGLLGVRLADDNAKRTADERLAVARLTVSFLDIEIAEQFEQLERAAAMAAGATDDVGDQRHILRDLLVSPEPFVASVFLTDRSGRLIWAEPPDSSDPGADLSAYAHVREPLATGARYASTVHGMGYGGHPTVVLAVPVPGYDGVPIGVVGAAIDPRHPALHSLIAATSQLGETGHAELVDQAGQVIVSSEPGRELGPAEHPGFFRGLQALNASGVGVTEPIGDEDPAERGQRHVMAFVPMVNAQWGLLLGGSEAEFLASTNRWLGQIALSGGLSLLVALGLVWATTRSVVRPVRVLTLASARIAAGDLATPVPRIGEGEVGALAEAFDEMRRDLSQAVEALAVEKSRYQGIVSSMADATFTTDARCRITEFNPAAEALTGRRAADVLGRPCHQAIELADARGSRVCQTNCALHPTAPLVSLAATKEVIKRRDGRPVPVATTRSAIRDLSGTAIGVVHVLRDVSADEEVSRLKDEFLATVSHELRTPLGFIKGYATTLLLPDGPRDEETTRRCLQVIVDASDELRDLVDNLLDMSRIGARALSIEPRPIRLAPIVRTAVEFARMRLRGRRLRDTVSSHLPLVAADARRVQQVLNNLLENALKYAPEGGTITVEAEARDGEIVVCVADQGPGIPVEDREGLFERFHRGKTARTQQIGGTGLGLAICKGIVEAHGGRIWCESPAPGRPAGEPPGAMLCFTLPIAPPNGRASRRKVRSAT